MPLVRSLVAGLILTIVLLSLASAFTVDLVASHSSCAPASTSTESSAQGFGVGNSSTYTNSTFHGPLSPLPVVSDALVLAPLAELSLTAPPQGGNDSAIADLTDPSYWAQIEASALKTEAELVPRTVLGFFNSSQEWRDWALQYIPEPPGWLTAGAVVYSQGLVLALEPGEGGTGNSTAIAQGIQDFAQSAAGLDLAALDYLTFNGLSAVKVLFQTNDAKLAACETLPGQLAQLYESAFDPALPRGERAQYLGQALAITSIMVIVGGKEGFAGKFQGGLDGVGMGDSWPAVKPYLGDIASKVSAGAASATFGVLQTLAQRFPSDASFATGFTADRVDSMVNVLQKKGVSSDVIQNDIGRIAQAAGTSADDEVPGEAADLDSLQQGGGMQVYVRSGNKMVLYDDATGDTATIRGTFLQQVLPDFDPRGPDFVQIHYKEAGVTAYHYYPKKVDPGASFGPSDTNWLPVVPADIASDGDVITISFDLLTPEQFVQSIPPIPYDDIARASWVADFSEITGFELSGNQIEMSVEQEPLEGVANFVVTGQASPLTNVGGDTFIEFTVADLVNLPETLKITFNGYGDPVLSIQSGTNFNPVTLVSFDGVKLKFVYDSGGDSVAVNTVYLKEPSVLWTAESAKAQDLGFVVQGASQTFKIAKVTPVRNLEWQMVNSGNSYDLARVGAEIAYTVAQKDLGVQNIRLNEPSQGGADLASGDGTVTIQARMLGNPSALSPANLEATLNAQMNDLADQVRYDFSQNSKFTIGYAILSYIDPTTQTITTLVAVIPKP